MRRFVITLVIDMTDADLKEHAEPGEWNWSSKCDPFHVEAVTYCEVEPREEEDDEP